VYKAFCICTRIRFESRFWEKKNSLRDHNHNNAIRGYLIMCVDSGFYLMPFEEEKTRTPHLGFSFASSFLLFETSFHSILGGLLIEVYELNLLYPRTTHASVFFRLICGTFGKVVVLLVFGCCSEDRQTNAPIETPYRFILCRTLDEISCIDILLLPAESMFTNTPHQISFRFI
jgi:hypothetical protein